MDLFITHMILKIVINRQKNQEINFKKPNTSFNLKFLFCPVTGPILA